jgi:hypothetical protein
VFFSSSAVKSIADILPHSTNQSPSRSTDSHVGISAELERGVIQIYYNYISITHYQSFNIILFTCKISISLTVISSINLYL